MKEVSTKVFTVLFPALTAKGVALERIVEGTSISVNRLRDRKERLDWSEYVAVMRNVRPHFTNEEYVELGRSWLRSPGLRFAFVVARLLFSA
ncbi:MAG: hypothetical protein JWO36_3550, partial [Myxococcales bacterium]|nr:hypothetical protein [Myxococcales bacterium]